MIKPLTSFRFIAALAVFCSHLFVLQNFKETSWIFNRIFYEGYLGVTFFFILSGFILTYNYHDKFNTIQVNNFSNFIKARFARIYPVYLLTFLISLPLVFSAYKLDLSNFFLVTITNLGMIQSFVPNMAYYFSFNAPAWSISNEMFFYLIFPIIILFISNIFNNAKKNQIFYLVIVVFLSYLIFFMYIWESKDSQIAHWLFYIFPLQRLYDFFIGIILGAIFIKLRKVELNNIFFSILEVTSLILLSVAFYYFPHVHQTLRFSIYYMPFMAFIIFIFAFQRGFISKFLSIKLFVYLGEISFSFYMVHYLIIKYLGKYTALGENPILFSLTTLISTLIISHLIYKYYEIPMKNKIKYKFSRH